MNIFNPTPLSTTAARVWFNILMSFSCNNNHIMRLITFCVFVSVNDVVQRSLAQSKLSETCNRFEHGGHFTFLRLFHVLSTASFLHPCTGGVFCVIGYLLMTTTNGLSVTWWYKIDISIGIIPHLIDISKLFVLQFDSFFFFVVFIFQVEESTVTESTQCQLLIVNPPGFTPLLYRSKRTGRFLVEN